MNFLTTPILYGLTAIALGAGAFAGLQTVRLSAEQTSHARTKQQHAEVLTGLANKAREAADLARLHERASAGRMNAAAESYERGKTDAKADYDRLLADQLAGVVRLQDRWTCPAARVPRTSAGAGEPDAEARLRAESASRIVQAVAECQAQRDGLQEVTKADRQ